MTDRRDRQRRWEFITAIWREYWAEPATDIEVERLRQELTHWDNLEPVQAAMVAAKRSLTDRPSVAWILRESRRRRSLRRSDGTRAGCRDCRGEQWRDHSERGERPMLEPCHTCQPLTNALWLEGHYDLDAPFDSHAKQLIVERYRAKHDP